jgi:hypothetical protein
MRLLLLCDATAFYLFAATILSRDIGPAKLGILEKPEKFEDDHYNDNHSNYVKDVSVHAGDS